MKKLVLFLLVSGVAFSAVAQDPANDKMDSIWKPKHFATDAMLSHWVVDINLLGGGAAQTYTNANSINNYYNAISGASSFGKLSFVNGVSYGADAQIAYFFGHSNHFGIGTGFMYVGEQGDAKLDNFYVAYQSIDSKQQVFRQLISTNGAIKEHQTMTNLNIPILLKYKQRLSHRWGITADAGALINLQMKSNYSTNANFNYEAIYQLDATGKPVYDNATTPNVNDILYTKAEYERVHPAQNDNTYFNTTLREAGYNVGLGVNPYKNNGNSSYMTGSVGFLVQPGVNYYFSDMVALNLGVYFLYQPFMNNNSNTTEMLSNKVGDYSSVLTQAKSITNMCYGLNAGVRIYLGKGSDRDHDGIPDRNDRCPDVYGSVRFNGCPDSDGDGIADIDDMCPHVPGIAKFNGCPDSDGDGIADKDDACPYNPGPARYHGCPDTDGDGIIDKDDACPTVPGVALYNGCPDTDGDGIPDNKDACPTIPGVEEYHGCPAPPQTNDDSRISIPILFEVDRTVIHKSSYPTLIEAAKKLNDNPEDFIIVDGYTDNTGSDAHNRRLSMRRAEAVKEHLVNNMGIDAKRIRIVGHAATDPVAPNDSAEGRLKNRRAVMHLTTSDK